jgi:hypothetical protein
LAATTLTNNTGTFQFSSNQFDESSSPSLSSTPSRSGSGADQHTPGGQLKNNSSANKNKLKKSGRSAEKQSNIGARRDSVDQLNGNKKNIANIIHNKFTNIHIFMYAYCCCL